ncbi:MAG: DUF3168 domain-containing protein [Endomicrobium sp.]|jgi:hypothetical protein|nr:DUF3168 domain-containing protein [Endomicrobium sp.]
MSLGIKLYNYLLQDMEITDLVSNRIYPLAAPGEAQKPYLAFRIVSDSSEYTLEGDSIQGRKQIQISVVFEDYAQANNIAVVLEQEMSKWTASETDIRIITKTGYAEIYEETTEIKRINLDFEVFAKN